MYIALLLDQEARIYEWKIQQQQVTEYCTEPVVWGRGRGAAQIVSKSLVSVKCVLTCSLFPRNLAAIQDREICCYSISCKEKDNIGNY